MQKIKIVRFGLFDDRTIGRLYYGSQKWWAIERPWLANLPFESCIPDGDYPVIRSDSTRFGRNQWEIVQVPQRSGIRIHVGNTAAHVQGCIALGMGLSPDLQSVTESQKAIQDFCNATANQDQLLIEIRKGFIEA